MTLGDRVTQLYPQTLGTHIGRLLRNAYVAVGLFLIPATIREVNVFTYALFNDAVRACNEWMIKTWERCERRCFGLIYGTIPGGGKENYEKPKPGYLTPCPRFELRTSLTRRSDDHLSATFKSFLKNHGPLLCIIAYAKT
jgi:hypothetical protein